MFAIAKSAPTLRATWTLRPDMLRSRVSSGRFLNRVGFVARTCFVALNPMGAWGAAGNALSVRECAFS